MTVLLDNLFYNSSKWGVFLSVSEIKVNKKSSIKLISKYKFIICALRNYNFRFQEKNSSLDWDSSLRLPDL